MLRLAIDTDVFLDLYEERANSAESRGLTTDWVREVARLVITKEVVTEINRHPDPSIRSRNRHNADGFWRADVATAEWEAAESVLGKALGDPTLGEHDQRDLRQVARAGAAKVDYFVSRDADLVERFEGVARRLFDLRVAAPGDCLQELWDRVSEPYAPAQIEHTRFRLEAASASAKDELSAAFLNTGLGEKKRDFARLLRGQRADPANCDLKVVRDGDNRCVALYGRSILGQVLDVAVLRAAGPAARTIARHVVHLQRRHAVDSGVPFVRISEVSLSPHLISALTSESFVESKDGWWAAAVNRHADAETLAQFLSALTDAPDDLGLLTAADSLRSGVARETVAELERRFAPMKLTGGPLPTYLVPIKPHWAEQLFDSDLVSQTLLRRNDILGLSREHVYYSGASPGTLAAPARILWYVSAGKVPGGRRAGTCAVRACSRLEEVVVDRPQTLHRRFSHLGIYTEDDVRAAANKRHRAMALRFADTEVFTHPVVLADLRDLADEYGHTLVLRSPQRMVEHLFDALYSRGTQ